MPVRQLVRMTPPSGARFALVDARRPNEALFAEDLEELHVEGDSGDAPLGMQIAIEQWAIVMPGMLASLSGSALITLLSRETLGPAVRAMARIGAQASADCEVVLALGAIGERQSTQTVHAANSTLAAWREVVERYGTLSSSDVATRVGSRAKNKAGAANDLMKAGRLIAVRRGSKRYEFPDFQFTADGAVIPVVEDVLTELRTAGWSDLSIVIWAASPSGWLADSAPADVWADPAYADRVRNAAHQDAVS